MIHFFFGIILQLKRSKKEQHLFKSKIFCNSINVSVAFDQFRASLLNKINNFYIYKKEKKLLNGRV